MTADPVHALSLVGYDRNSTTWLRMAVLLVLISAPPPRTLLVPVQDTVASTSTSSFVLELMVVPAERRSHPLTPVPVGPVAPVAPFVPFVPFVPLVPDGPV